MIAPEKTIIYIANQIGDHTDIYKAILYHLCKEVDCKLCTIKRDKYILKAQESEFKEIRFGCVTPKTRTAITLRLLQQEQAIPILLIGDDDDDMEKYENILVDIYCLDREYVERMIFNISSLNEISGAIKWVHLYYYQLLEMEKEKQEKLARKLRELKKKIGIANLDRAIYLDHYSTGFLHS